jgi:hypothetical protein
MQASLPENLSTSMTGPKVWMRGAQHPRFSCRYRPLYGIHLIFHPSGSAPSQIHTFFLSVPTQCPLAPLSFELLPAVGRVTITSPAVMRSLAKLNLGKKYGDRLKPFNFLLSCHVKQFGHPPGIDPERFHLVAPYESDPSRWVEMPWVDQYMGKHYQITTEGLHGTGRRSRFF